MLNKSPPLAQRWQNIEISNLRSGWQATVGPMLAKSADYATNSQCQSDSRILSGYVLYNHAEI